jgi:Na+-driven multidrug efflux pump
MALVFPCVILTMTMSGGAMGGGVASAIARALGAGDRDRASALAAHSLLIGICFGLVFMLGMLIFGPQLLEALGGRGNVLAQAIAYTQIFFGGAVIPWLMNTMAGIFAAPAHEALSSLMLSSAAARSCSAARSARPWADPSFGMRGVAAGSPTAYIISISVMSWYMFSGRARGAEDRGLRIQWSMFIDILKVGAIARFSPLQSVLTISIFTHMLAGSGTRDPRRLRHRRPARIHATSIAFAVGIASVLMVGMVIGAGKIARARRIADRRSGFVHVGRRVRHRGRDLPDLWVSIFTDDAAVRAQAGSICRRRRRCTPSLGLPPRCIFPRKVRPR